MVELSRPSTSQPPHEPLDQLLHKLSSHPAGGALVAVGGEQSFVPLHVPPQPLGQVEPVHVLAAQEQLGLHEQLR
jgi:hypothetical protein